MRQCYEFYLSILSHFPLQSTMTVPRLFLGAMAKGATSFRSVATTGMLAISALPRVRLAAPATPASRRSVPTLRTLYLVLRPSSTLTAPRREVPLISPITALSTKPIPTETVRIAVRRLISSTVRALVFHPSAFLAPISWPLLFRPSLVTRAVSSIVAGPPTSSSRSWVTAVPTS
jgi:hypothetical protein